jgi:adenylate cyclase
MCFEKAPMGGVDMEIGVLFADIRGFTSLAERTPTGEVARLLNRFYAAASAILTRSALIDKFVGDQVMALYLPQLLGEHWEDELVRDANDLLASVGFGTSPGPWLQLGVGLDIGRAYVGNVGAGEVKDFTAVGDVVNTAARLQSAAGGGQIILSERLFERLAARPDNATATSLRLKGKQDAEPARVIDLGAATTA